MIDENNSPEAVGGTLWLIWLASAALAPAFWPSGPQVAMDLFLLVPISLLAATTVGRPGQSPVPVRT